MSPAAQKWLVGIAGTIAAGFIMAATGKAVEVLTFQAVIQERMDRLEAGQVRIESKVDEINRHLRDSQQ